MATRAERLRIKENAIADRHMVNTLRGVYRSGHKTMYIEREKLTLNVIRALKYLGVRYRLKLLVQKRYRGDVVITHAALSMIFEP